MPKIKYVEHRFSAETRRIIEQANRIIGDYQRQGYDLTLRQLYYQFVSRALIPNSDREYKRLGSVINDARLAGFIDWYAITDRTRNLRSVAHWDAPGDVIESAAASFRMDKWANQRCRIEVWIEKDALVGVIGGICTELDVPYFSCRGYTSQSEMWSASRRLAEYMDNGQQPVILHLGDHDPSGMDMTRDIRDRLNLFSDGIDVDRLALNMDQIEEYDPPPNPAKISDARAAVYIAHFGESSWELDALEPSILSGLVRTAVETMRDHELWDESVEEERTHRAQLSMASRRWQDIAKTLVAP